MSERKVRGWSRTDAVTAMCAHAETEQAAVTSHAVALPGVQTAGLHAGWSGLLSGGEAGGVFAECGGEASEGAGTAGCTVLAFEPADGGEANPRLPGQVRL